MDDRNGRRQALSCRHDGGSRRVRVGACFSPRREIAIRLRILRAGLPSPKRKATKSMLPANGADPVCPACYRARESRAL